MSDKRFQKTERAIFIAYFTLRDYPSAKKLARTAHISRSTLYRHHQKIHAIPAEYEEYLLQNYIKSIDELLANNVGIRTIFLRTLVFISSNKAVFIVLFEGGHKNTICAMMEYLKTRVTDEWHLEGNLDKIYGIYKYEVIGLIEIWSERRFAVRQLKPTLDDILYLTNAARRNLLPLQ